MIDFQQLISRLQDYWAKQGCLIMQPLDIKVGAGTFHPATFLHALGPEHHKSAYVQPSRRPTDGRYGENPNRLQGYYQFQVLLKPSPDNIVDLFFDSLLSLDLDPKKNDLRLIEDNWESPTLGAWGLGWEVWINGMEVAQFTYFQQVGGQDCKPISGELTYGLERIAMYLQQVDDVHKLVWSQQAEAEDGKDKQVTTYGDLFKQNEREQSAYNFEHADIDVLLLQFKHACDEASKLSSAGLSLPAYEQALEASHIFNLLDARQALSVSERQQYILKVRGLTAGVAKAYLNTRLEAGFPLVPQEQREEVLAEYKNKAEKAEKTDRADKDEKAEESEQDK